jgi:hypothetical protein
MTAPLQVVRSRAFLRSIPAEARFDAVGGRDVAVAVEESKSMRYLYKLRIDPWALWPTKQTVAATSAEGVEADALYEDRRFELRQQLSGPDRRTPFEPAICISMSLTGDLLPPPPEATNAM